MSIFIHCADAANGIIYHLAIDIQKRKLEILILVIYVIY
jgi:hypothetical protein